MNFTALFANMADTGPTKPLIQSLIQPVLITEAMDSSSIETSIERSPIIAAQPKVL